MTPEAARDEIYTVFKRVWDSKGYTAVWPDIPGSSPPSEEIIWARVTLKHAEGGQTSLSNHIGSKMYDHRGTLFIQVFIPIGQGEPGYALTRAVLAAYRVAHGSVRYKNQRFNEGGQDGAFTVFHCKIDFEYDDFT